tara:strand:+ start:634 stop:1539 length:906 start_codon:yes stop_codon:yes gene_type:complete
MGILRTDQEAYYASGGDHGNYQSVSLLDIINTFKATYVGKGKICENCTDQDITFFATRGMQELSYDTLKCFKDWEIEVPATLVMVMPVDYVNYVKLSWSDASGIEHIIYPTRYTSNPRDITTAVNDDGGFTTGSANTDVASDESSTTWENYKSSTVSEQNDDYEDDTYWPNLGGRFGLSPENAQVNGSFYIDEDAGKFHFSSNLAGKTLILKYISDGLVTNASNTALDLSATKIHKFAEEAIYKYMAYGLLSARTDVNAGILGLLKKERFAEQRKAKLRLSNLKIGELTQIMRGKSKVIKH